MTKIKYITHACLDIELNNLKILTDPWLNGPSWGGNIWHFPKNKIEIEKIKRPDYIYFSHGHDDHFHNPTISKMPEVWKKKCTVITPDFGEIWWNNEIKSAGFKNVIFLKNGEIFKANKETTFKVYINDCGDTDSSLLIEHKDKKIFLQTDNIMSSKAAKKIAKENKIDIAFCMPFMTGSFPAFYRVKPIKSNFIIKGSKIKKERSLEYSTNIIKILKPKFTVPYACDIAYMGENFFANLVMSHDKNDFKNKIIKKKIKTQVKIMSQNDIIQFKNHSLKIKLSVYKHNNKELIKFYYENLDEFDKVSAEEKKYIKPDIKKLTKIFIKKLKNYFTQNNANINFKITFKIKEAKDSIINVKLTKKSIVAKESHIIDTQNNLIIEIESFRLRRMLNGDYPMQFLTFHNGGYHCTRRTLKLTSNEKKFWEWINFFAF